MQEVIPGFLNRKEMPDLFTDALIQGTQNIGTQRNEKSVKKLCTRKEEYKLTKIRGPRRNSYEILLWEDL